MRRTLLILIMTCAAAVAKPEDAACEFGEGPRGRAAEMGLPQARVNKAKEACRAKGLDDEAIANLFQPVSAARAESLPSDCVFLKIEEGLAKGAPFDAVRAAAMKRLDCLRRAAALVTAARKRRGGQHEHLLSHICVALESGLSEEAIAAALSHGEFRYGRLIHVIEAGETMRLAGMTSEDVQLVMVDCLDRGLTRPEVFRVADLAVEKTRDGERYTAVRSEIWTSEK